MAELAVETNDFTITRDEDATPSSQDFIVERNPVASGVESDILRPRRSVMAAAIESAITGEDLSTTYFKKLADMVAVPGRTGADQLNEAAKAFNLSILGTMRDLVGEQVGAIPDTDEALAATTSGLEAIAKQEELDGRASAKYRAYVDSVATASATEEVKEDLAVRYQLMDEVAVILEDIGILESLGDLGLEIIFAPAAIMDNAAVVGFDINPFRMEERFREMVGWFGGLPPEEKLKMFPILMEEWIGEMEIPRGKAAAMALAMLDPDNIDTAAMDFGLFGAIDMAAIGAGSFAFLAKALKKLNAVRSAVKLRNNKQASEINLEVMKGTQDSKAVGIDQETAVINAGPFDGDKIDVGSSSIMGHTMQKLILEFKKLVDNTLSPLVDEEQFVREGLLDVEDMERAFRGRVMDEWNVYSQNVLGRRNGIVNLDKTKVDSRGVEFQYTVVNQTGDIEIGKHKIFFKEDDIGMWENLPDNVLKRAIGSELWQMNDSTALSSVRAAIRLDTTSTSIADQFRTLAKEATKGLRKGTSLFNRKERVKVIDAYLIYGDKAQRVWTEQELKAGVNGMRGLDEGEISAYYKLRTLFTGLGLVRNQEKYLDFVQRGVMKVDFGGKLHRFGAVKHTVEDAKTTLTRNRGTVESVWVQDSVRVGRSVPINKVKVDKLYEQGYRLVVIEDDILRGGQTFRHVFVKGERIGNLPGIVTDMKVGYVPRMNRNTTWFVQQFRNTMIDGVKSTTRKAVRSFDNEIDAQKWRGFMEDQLTDAQKKQGFTYREVADGELEAFRAGSSGLGSTRGLVTGPRAAEQVPHGMPGEFTKLQLEDMRVGAFDSLELYLENTKNFMTRGQWRMGMQKKWEKTAEFVTNSRTKIDFNDPGAALNNKALADMHDRITTWSGFYSKSERGWENTIKSLYEWSVGKIGRGRISDFLMRQRMVDPLTRLRSGTFHSLLGFFNPIQLWVQAQGAAVAMSVNLARPHILAKVFAQQHSLALVQHMDPGDAIMDVIRKGTAYESLEEFRATKKLWDQTGYFNSTTSSADIESAARGFPTAAGAWRRTLDSGLMFFRQGELFNRRFGFLTALEEAGGAVKVAGDAFLMKRVMDRTNDFILNLSKGNRARWQKGFLSIPTQFLQIQAKTLETVLGANGALKLSERYKLFFSQAMLYGPAGMVGGGLGSRYAAEVVGLDTIDINNMSDEKLAFLNGGLTDWMLQIMGIDALGSERGALFNGLDQSVFDIFTEENTGFEFLLGPSSVPLTRFWDKFTDLSPLSWTPQPIDGRTNLKFEDFTDAAVFFGQEVWDLASSPFSSMSQLAKWQLMNDLSQMQDANGELIVASEFNWQTKMATLIGFKPELLQRKFDLGDLNQSFNDAVDARVSLLMYNHQMLLKEIEVAREEDRPTDRDMLRRSRKRWQFIVDSIGDPGLRRAVRERYKTKVSAQMSGESQLDRQVQTYYRHFIEDLEGEINRLESTRLVKTKNEQQ